MGGGEGVAVEKEGKEKEAERGERGGSYVREGGTEKEG